MTTTQLEYWRVAHLHLAEDQHPGCHTHASGFDYIPFYNEADKAIDETWARELHEARVGLVRTLQKKIKK